MVTKADVIKYEELSEELSKLRDEIEMAVKPLIKIYSKINGHAFDYIEEVNISNGFINVETIGYRFGTVSNYYNIPISYLFDENAYEKIEADVKNEIKTKTDKHKLKREEEEKQEYDRLKKKYED